MNDDKQLVADCEAPAARPRVLLHAGVFTADVIDTWIWYEREQEAGATRLRPRPYEFALYYDI